MPWLPLPADHCQTAADVREQCGRIIRSRRRGSKLKRWVRVGDRWARTDRETMPSAAQFFRATDSPAMKILDAVCNHFGVNLESIRSVDRTVCLEPRRAALYLLKTHTHLNFHALGSLVGRRDTIAIHSYYKVASLLQADPDHVVSIAVRNIQGRLGLEAV